MLYSIIIVISLFSCKNRQRVVNVPPVADLSAEELIEINKKLVTGDRERISAYLAYTGESMKETKTGLWYRITEKGSGQPVTYGSQVTIDYTVTLLDGAVCYTSAKSGPRQFIPGEGQVESGLEEGIMLLEEGDRARFILPPHLAHGLVGDDYKIPPRAIIIYEIELLAVN